MAPRGPAAATALTLERPQVLWHRTRSQELLRAEESRADTDLLDLGVQDTGPDGAAWALRLRGCDPAPDELLLAWTLRGAPHAYRRSDAAAVAAAVAPWSETDAGKRIFDAARPLRQAGIPVQQALAHLARVMADLVTGPTPKGTVSAQLTARLDPPYLRWCRPCGATHTFEQPFRLAALQAGLELEPGTSPPVLRPVPGWTGPATRVAQRLDPVRAVLHLLGPSTPRLVAAYLDSTVKEVAARWPADVVPVQVDGVRADVLEGDLPALRQAGPVRGVALLGPFDPYLQARDRSLLVPDETARKDLWRTLGRPGALLVDGEVVGTWRPRTARGRLRLEVVRWDGDAPPAGLDEEAGRLASYRDVTFAGYL